MARNKGKSKKSRKEKGRPGRNAGGPVAEVLGLDAEAAAGLDSAAAVAVLADAVAPESKPAIVPPAPEPEPPAAAPGAPTVVAPTAANAQAAPAAERVALFRTGTHSPAPGVADTAEPDASEETPTPSPPLQAVGPGLELQIDPGDAAAAAGELEPGEAPPWYHRIVVADEEDAAMTIADWATYAQAALAGGANSPDEAVADADVLMHEQLRRHAILMARVAPAPPLADDLDAAAEQS